MKEALLAIALTWAAVAGTAVVLTREPLHQAFVTGFFGLSLANLYLNLQAGDVSLSQLVVGAIALPLIILLALAKIGKVRQPAGDEGDAQKDTAAMDADTRADAPPGADEGTT